MAKQRGPDGAPIDIPSITPAEPGGDAPTAQPKRSLFAERRSLFAGAEKTTKPITASRRGSLGGGEPRTMVAGGFGNEAAAESAKAVEAAADPVVG